MRSLGVAALVACAACASTSPEPAFKDVSALVEQRTGQRVRWNQAGSEDAAVERAVKDLLTRELTTDAAVQVALLNNPRLLATYEELSIGQADVVQAGLLKNPVFGARITAAERDALDPNLLFDVSQDFLGVLLLPARKKVAETQLEEVKLRVADQVLDLASEVRSALYTTVGAMQVLAMRRLVRDAALAASELAKRQAEAGNRSELSQVTEQGLFEQVDLDAGRSEGDVVVARERLTRLMGVWGQAATFRVPDRLAGLPKEEVSLEHLESTAVAQRLDLQAARKEVEATGYALSLVRSSRWVGALDVGVEGGRLKSGNVAVGPSASVELPIFDQRQAAVARLEAQLRASEHRYAARAIDIRSEVRAARERVLLARRVVDRYKTTLVPLRERIVALAQQEYDAMLLGVYELLLAKQNEVNAYREYIEATRDYWIARSDLERAVGGRLAKPGSAASEAGTPAGAGPVPAAPQPATAPMHHH